jgi:predicted CxxxxCH...CXXCH cytochrome family protein
MNNATVLGTNFECAQCHNATVSLGNDRVITGTVHANGTKDVAFQLGGTWAAGSMSCSSVYCHSSGKGTYANPPAWGSATDLGCNACHGTGNSLGRPDYANGGAGTASANSHAKHAATAADCGTCHTNTTATGMAIRSGSTLHTNSVINITFDAAKAGAGAAYNARNRHAAVGRLAPCGLYSLPRRQCDIGSADHLAEPS